MRKSLTTLILPILISSTTFAQRRVEDNLFSLNVLAPGATYEFAVGNASTINASLEFGILYRNSDFFEDGFGIYPGGTLQYRFYNNFKRRESKGKNTFGNMANFFAPSVYLQSGNPLIGDLETVSDLNGGAGVIYGLQRTGKKGFQFNLMFGPFVFFDDFDTEAGLLLDVRLGFVLGAKKKFNN